MWTFGDWSLVQNQSDRRLEDRLSLCEAVASRIASSAQDNDLTAIRSALYVVVERNGEAICRITPVAPEARTLSDVAALLASVPRPDAGFWAKTIRARWSRQDALR